MAGPDGNAADPLIEKLKAEPHAFDFFAALRHLQSRAQSQPRIGHSRALDEDPVRFAQSPALDFAPATLEAVQQKPGGVPVIYARHFGLFGPQGPLPLCLTEYARDRILHHGDRTFASFCNVFHHRLLSFFFRAWADAQQTVDLDRPSDQQWASYVGSVTGLGMSSLLRRDSVPDRAKLFYAGRLAHQPRNAEGLEAIVQHFFGIPTQVQTFVGRWLKLPEGSECRLGQSTQTGTLGATVVVGSKVWTCQMHFRIRLGPMPLADFERFLPQGPACGRLRDWVRNYDGAHHGWDVQLVLDRDEVPSVRLGQNGRLGWTTWLKTVPFARDAEDLVLEGDSL